jgi:3-phenylpropionate/trans-cinnamate dioxygenase ferredoxin subunit
MSEWIDVCERAALSEASPKVCVRVADRPVVAVLDLMDGQTVRVVANVCPHAGLPLGEGDLRGRVLTCPYHGYAYDTKTGRNVDYADDDPLAVYPTRVEAGVVQVKFEETA